MNTISATPYIASNKKLTLSDPDWVRYILDWTRLGHYWFVSGFSAGDCAD